MYAATYFDHAADPQPPLTVFADSRQAAAAQIFALVPSAASASTCHAFRGTDGGWQANGCDIRSIRNPAPRRATWRVHAIVRGTAVTDEFDSEQDAHECVAWLDGEGGLLHAEILDPAGARVWATPHDHDAHVEARRAHILAAIERDIAGMGEAP